MAADPRSVEDAELRVRNEAELVLRAKMHGSVAVPPGLRPSPAPARAGARWRRALREDDSESGGEDGGEDEDGEVDAVRGAVHRGSSAQAFACDGGCGFRGPFDKVARHELACPRILAVRTPPPPPQRQQPGDGDAAPPGSAPGDPRGTLRRAGYAIALDQSSRERDPAGLPEPEIEVPYPVSPRADLEQAFHSLEQGVDILPNSPRSLRARPAPLPVQSPPPPPPSPLASSAAEFGRSAYDRPDDGGADGQRGEDQGAPQAAAAARGPSAREAWQRRRMRAAWIQDDCPERAHGAAPMPAAPAPPHGAAPGVLEGEGFREGHAAVRAVAGVGGLLLDGVHSVQGLVDAAIEVASHVASPTVTSPTATRKPAQAWGVRAGVHDAGKPGGDEDGGAAESAGGEESIVEAWARGGGGRGGGRVGVHAALVKEVLLLRQSNAQLVALVLPLPPSLPLPPPFLPPSHSPAPLLRILQNMKSCGLSVPRCHEFPETPRTLKLSKH